MTNQEKPKCECNEEFHEPTCQKSEGTITPTVPAPTPKCDHPKAEWCGLPDCDQPAPTPQVEEVDEYFYGAEFGMSAQKIDDIKKYITSREHQARKEYRERMVEGLRKIDDEYEDAWIVTKDGSEINPTGFAKKALQDAITFIKNLN